MAVIKYTGGGGSAEAAAVPVYHLDAGKLAHWKFDGDGTDAIGTYPTTDAYVQQPYFNDGTQRYCTQITNGSPISSIAATGLQTYGAVTVAAWIYVTAYPAGNCAVVGFRGGGTGSTNNFVWTLDMQSGGNLRMFWQNGAKNNNSVVGPTSITLNTWTHVIGTRETSGTVGRVYINGSRDVETTGLTAPTDGASQDDIRFGHDAASTEWEGLLASAVVYHSSVDDAAAAALYNEARGL